ncbi:MAG: hypothetical protein ACE5E6_07610 [Phycisphaerae bacterium]
MQRSVAGAGRRATLDARAAGLAYGCAYIGDLPGEKEDARMAAELICVRRTNTVEEADIIVAWLAERDIEAHVLDRDNFGVMAFGATDLEGIAIGVAGEEVAARARALLAAHDRAPGDDQASDEAARGVGTIEVTCEECGSVATFPGASAGAVEQCPACRAYIDVPAGEGPRSTGA